VPPLGDDDAFNVALGKKQVNEVPMSDCQRTHACSIRKIQSGGSK